MDVTTCTSADEAKHGLAMRVSAELRLHSENGTPVLLFFSGGSALGILDRLDADVFGPDLTMAPLDERFDPDGAENNFAAFAVTEAFLRAVSSETNFIDTRVRGGEGRDVLEDRFEQAIRKWMAEHPEGKTIAILGMGPDGHTAGIFPMDGSIRFHELFEGDRLVVGYRGPEYAVCPERVTTTFSLIRCLDRTFVFFSGEEKRPVWERVTRNMEPLHSLPAGIFHAIQDVEIFTDLV